MKTRVRSEVVLPALLLAGVAFLFLKCHCCSGNPFKCSFLWILITTWLRTSSVHSTNPRISARLSAANPSSTRSLENTDEFPLYTVLPFQDCVPSSRTAHSLSKPASFRSAPRTEVLRVAPCVSPCLLSVTLWSCI